ncbi:uncharacterized protein LOC143039711 isoform X2 [Oratosquilla oratoria]|uniref:uncharacterized protein LOC143039711 isoform X2 n=1 Tax=Oratosquilla oratoria TaxID=337810 RepID=UPI003F76B872
MPRVRVRGPTMASVFSHAPTDAVPSSLCKKNVEAKEKNNNGIESPNMETSTQAQLKNYAVLAASASLSSFLKTNVDILSSGQCSQTTLRVHS